MSIHSFNKRNQATNAPHLPIQSIGWGKISSERGAEPAAPSFE